MIDVALQSYMQEQLKQTSLGFKRYKYAQIDWDVRMIALMGPRGIGKTTLLLQHIMESGKAKLSLYVSADHSYFSNHSLVDLADEFVKQGGEYLYLDEVHKYPNWSRELKQMYDTHPALNIVFTGSSVLDILKGEADLSRRAVGYLMQGLSFREYLELFHNIKTPVLSLEQVLEGEANIEGVLHPLPYFQTYLKTGYYPFAKEKSFFTRLEQVVTQTVESDIPQFANMSVSTGRKLRQMLAVIAESAPFKPEANALANELKISRNVVPDYLLYLEKAGLIGQLRDATGGMRGLGKTEKVYLDNTNLMYALAGSNTEMGNARETFFYNQTRVAANVVASKVSDFEIGKFTFEVGGKNKSRRQVAELENAFVVKDDIEYASGNIIPLWAFGLLY